MKYRPLYMRTSLSGNLKFKKGNKDIASLLPHDSSLGKTKRRKSTIPPQENNESFCVHAQMASGRLRLTKKGKKKGEVRKRHDQGDFDLIWKKSDIVKRK